MVDQLCILCDVKACAIVYDPHDPNPEVWPSMPGAHRVLSQFRSLPPLEQSGRMIDKSEFLEKMITKVKKQLKQKKRENQEFEITKLVNQIMRGNGLQDDNEDLSDMKWLLEKKMLSIEKRMEELRSGMISESPACHEMPTPMQLQTEVGCAGDLEADKSAGASNAVGVLQGHEWFTDVMPYGDNGSLPGAFFSG